MNRKMTKQLSIDSMFLMLIINSQCVFALNAKNAFCRVDVLAMHENK